ncbi:unnamed protein product, partial [Cuscuta europaea]
MWKLIHDKDASLMDMCRLEEALRQATEGAEQRLRSAVEEAKAEAERIDAEAAKKGAEEVEGAKAEAVAAADKSAVENFVAEGWTAEGRKDWVSSVGEKSVDAWVEGPGKMWLAERCDSYYQGGEFFTQHLIYRRLIRHFGIPLEQFDPAVHPDVRVPLSPGEEKSQIEDSVMMGGSDEGGAEDDVGGE